MNTLLLILALGAVLGAAAVDWGGLARGAGRLWLRLRTQGVTLRGEWRLELVGPDGMTKELREWSKNVVVNTGLDHLKALLLDPASGLSTMDNVAIGTDATTEDPTDTALGAEVARAVGAYAPGGTGVALVSYTFPASGGYEPAAIAEAGLFDQPTLGGTLLARKTFAAFTKEATDTLKVVCTLTVTSA